MGNAPCTFQAISVAVCLLLSVGRAVPESFQVLGPTGPISATVGASVLLPCHLAPALSTQTMQVKWRRPPLNQDVHVYWPDESEMQGTGYRGRTGLLSQGLAHGNISLTIQNIRPSDNGQYMCEVVSPTDNSSALLELTVTSTGSDPILHITGYKDRGVEVTCLSAGWYPSPQVVWRNSRGEILRHTSEWNVPGNDGLFNVSSSVVVAEKSDPVVTCTIRGTFSGPERRTTIRITGLIPRRSPEIRPFLLLLPLCLFLVPLAVYLFRKRSALEEEASREREEASREREWREFLDKAYLSAAEVTLDKDTMNPFLMLSADGRSVKCGFLWQEMAKTDQIFDSLPCVLASQGFESGQHYWDVEVSQSGDWAIGVARGSMERMGALLLSPDVGVWALQYQEGNWSTLACPKTTLNLESAPRVVRVHMDCERRSLAFYNADSMAHIFTFPGCSKGRVYPFFLLQTPGTELTIQPPWRSHMGRQTRQRAQ
uniref:Butyrophilin subfamily 1 member A1-like n=1 Tax=Pelusios castaneus TaxID=367368 RepID=A0A8C8SB51_9SAUR